MDKQLCLEHVLRLQVRGSVGVLPKEAIAKCSCKQLTSLRDNGRQFRGWDVLFGCFCRYVAFEGLVFVKIAIRE